MSSKLSGIFLRKKRLNKCLQRTVDFSVCRQKKPYFGKNYPCKEIIQENQNILISVQYEEK